MVLPEVSKMERRGVGVGCSVAFVLVIVPQAVFGDELPQLKAQVEQLQQENQTLQDQLNRQGEVTDRLLRKIEALEKTDQALSQAVQQVKERPVAPAEERAAVSEAGVQVPRLSLRGFAEIGFNAKITGDESNTSFLTEEIDLFMTAELSDQVSALVEADFFSPDTNAMTFGLQRVVLRYALSDLLNIKIGRIHTPLGYWNEAFHHGSWLQTTVARPEIYRFERDDGGFVPVHSVGLELSGVMEFAPVDFTYHVAVLNGRGRTVTEVQHARDKNDSKAINVLLNFKPHLIEGLEFGPLVYWDRIPGDPPAASRRDRIDEVIVGGHVIYLQDPVELLGEFFHISHDDKTLGKDFNTLGFYLQGAYQLTEKVKPYYRLDFIDVANSDPYFTGARAIDRSKHTIGLRWDAFTWNALKFEYNYADRRASDNEHMLAVNSSFAF